MKFSCLLFILSLSLSLSAQQFPDRHSTDIADSWTSCTPTENPNKVREESHWIMYDFGNEYTLQGSTIWNVNGYEHTDKGAQDLVIDYSIDGQNWIELGYHTLEQAPASSYYVGEEGPNFNGVNARYVIITSLSNYGHATCHGLSEVRFEATIASTTTNTEEILADNNINISPNPFQNTTQVTFIDMENGDYNYSVVDISGKQVMTGTASITSDNATIPLDMSSFSTGSYIFKLQYGSLTLSRKIQLVK